MADKATSALTGATTPLAGTELVYVVQGGNSRKATVADLAPDAEGVAYDNTGSGLVSTNVQNAIDEVVLVVASAAGDMTKAVYDPNSVEGDAFDQDNMVDGTTNKNFTATEQTKLAGIEAAADVTDAGNVGSTVHGATGKTTPVDNDEVALIDSAASNVLKKLLWSNIKATLKTYFDTLYTGVGSAVNSSRQIISGAGLTGGGDLSADRTLVVGAGTGITVNADDVQIATAYQAIGKQTIYIPASAMAPATTNGPATGQLETSSNKVNVPVLDFDATTAEQAWFNIAFPKGWNLSTVTFQAFWASTATDTDGVAISLAGVAFSDNETLDTAVGTPIVVTDDAQSNASELYVTAESSAVTIAGTPAADDLCTFRVQRVVGDANDDMSEDMRLIGIKLFYTTTAANDA